jgi:NAD-dependent dihydropyrimidine dehydrogenase PreA subunit
MGLELGGAELADHVSIELEFLAYLCEQEALLDAHTHRWRMVRQLFVKEHAACWMPDVGRALARSSDEAWQAIGQLLSAVCTKPHQGPSARSALPTLPQIADAEMCTLCGFCVQICPTQALRVQENEQNTTLYLLAAQCTHCAKCQKICPEQAVTMAALGSVGKTAVLRQSPRGHCPACHTATISEAEITAVAKRLEYHPDWLDYCLSCRARL